MGARRDNLDIFFHRVASDSLLRDLQANETLRTRWISHAGMDQELYFRLAASVFTDDYSENECAVFYRVAMQSMTEGNDNW